MHADNAKHMKEWETGGVIMTHAAERAGRRGDDPSTAVIMILRLQIVRAARYIGDTHGLQGSVEVLCSVPRAPQRSLRNSGPGPGLLTFLARISCSGTLFVVI